MRRRGRWFWLKLAAWAVPLLVLGAMVTTPVSVMRPVRDASGAVVHRPDGRVRVEGDPVGNLIQNSPGWLCYGSGVVLLVVGAVGWLQEGALERREKAQEPE